MDTYNRIENPVELGKVTALDPNLYNRPKKEKRCNNVCWAVLFFIVFGSFIASGSYGIYVFHFNDYHIKEIPFFYQLTFGEVDVEANLKEFQKIYEAELKGLKEKQARANLEITTEDGEEEAQLTKKIEDGEEEAQLTKNIEIFTKALEELHQKLENLSTEMKTPHERFGAIPDKTKFKFYNFTYGECHKSFRFGVGAAVLVAMIYSVLAICLLKSCAGQSGGIIKCSMITYAVGTVAIMAGILAYFKLSIFSLVLGGTFFLWFIIMLLVWWCAWNHIAFAEESLKTAMQALQHNPLIVFIPIIFSIFSIISIVLFLYSNFGFLVLTKTRNIDLLENPIVKRAITLFLCFTFFWVSLVLTNIVHVTCCAYIAGLLLGGEFRVSVCESFGIACRNIGAISFGSFILALIKLARDQAEEGMREKNQDADSFIFYLIIYFVATCIDGLIEYVSEYAYVFVAMYENDFMSAAQNSWNLLQERGLHMVFNDSVATLPGTVFSIFGANVSGFVTAFTVFKIASETLFPQDSEELSTASEAPKFEKDVCIYLFLFQAYVAGFLIGWIISSSIFGILSSYVQTIFVIFAEHPEVLARKHPEIYIGLNNAIHDKIQTDPQKYQIQQL